LLQERWAGEVMRDDHKGVLAELVEVSGKSRDEFLDRWSLERT
jgi:hypothetical protein